VDGACYVTVDAVGIYMALREHGIDPFRRLPATSSTTLRKSRHRDKTKGMRIRNHLLFG
jgi:hypothetical protein